MFDADGNGQITKDELQKLLGGGVEGSSSAKTKKMIDQMIKDNDTDGDGTISFDEFVFMM